MAGGTRFPAPLNNLLAGRLRKGAGGDRVASITRLLRSGTAGRKKARNDE
jgi:hypothetical protein